jgi:hypothetical protein
MTRPASVEVHIRVMDADGTSDTLDGTYTSVSAAHAEVQKFFTDLRIRMDPPPPEGGDHA